MNQHLRKISTWPVVINPWNAFYGFAAQHLNHSFFFSVLCSICLVGIPSYFIFNTCANLHTHTCVMWLQVGSWVAVEVVGAILLTGRLHCLTVCSH